MKKKTMKRKAVEKPNKKWSMFIAKQEQKNRFYIELNDDSIPGIGTVVGGLTKKDLKNIQKALTQLIEEN